MQWKNSEPPMGEDLLVKFGLVGGDEYHVCQVNDDGDYVDEYGDDLGYNISADFDWILLDDILPNIAEAKEAAP